MKQSEFRNHRDRVGATPLLAILVGNSEEALRLCTRLVESVPSYMLVIHDGEPGLQRLFSEESALHLLVVNKHYDHFLRWLRLAKARLSGEEVQRLLSRVCSGAFFDNLPYRNFGGHVLSYLCASGHTAVLRDVIGLGFSEWATWRDELTSYLPIHVAANTGQRQVVELLVETFGKAQLEEMTVGQLVPLQLATRVGQQSIVQRLLEYDVRTEWSWGPTTKKVLQIRDVLDSDKEEHHMTVLELIARYDASRRTQELLSDDCMRGLLFELIREKWRNQARVYFGVTVLLLGLYALSLTIFACPSIFALGGASPRLLAATTLAFALVSVEEEVRELTMWIQQSRAEEASARRDKYLGFAPLATSVWRMLTLRHSEVRYTSLLCALLACLLVLSATDADAAFASERVRVLLALACSTCWLLVFMQIFVPFEHLGVFSAMVGKMLFQDVRNFLIVQLPIMLAFSTSMHVLHAHAPAARYSLFWSTMETLFMMLFVGADVNMNEASASGAYFDRGSFKPEDSFAPVLFYLLYVTFIIVSVILMLNLLIALMSSTYESSQLEATLTWRISFARLVFRMDTLGPRVLKRATKVKDRDIFVEAAASDPFQYAEQDLLGGGGTAADSNAMNRYELLTKSYALITEMRSEQREMRAENRALHAKVETLERQFATSAPTA